MQGFLRNQVSPTASDRAGRWRSAGMPTAPAPAGQSVGWRASFLRSRGSRLLLHLGGGVLAAFKLLLQLLGLAIAAHAATKIRESIDELLRATLWIDELPGLD